MLALQEVEGSFSPLTALITAHCQRLASQAHWHEDMGLYVPTQAKETLYATSTFSLDLAVQRFLAEDQRVLLLLGESGSGKSLFSQAIVRMLAEDYRLGSWIPLFVLLPTLQNPKKALMEEALTNAGFPKEAFNTLKQQHRFFMVLDAYDEIYGLENLYRSNGLEEWQVKIMITCRSAYLTQLNHYPVYFMPFRGEMAQQHLFQELYIAPFTLSQIEGYIQQYLLIKKIEIQAIQATQKMLLPSEFITEDWLQPKTYHFWIDQISGLKDLVQNPFLLHIAMQILPSLVVQYQRAQKQQERFIITRAKLYDAFINHWFMRQEERLMGQGRHPGHSLQKDYWLFAKTLAKKMHEKQITQVTYDEGSDIFGEAQSNEWALFFSDRFVPSDKKDEKRHNARILARKGCPLRQVGQNQYAFIHTSLLEYFVAEYIVEFRHNEHKVPQKQPVKKKQQNDNLLDSQGNIQLSIHIPSTEITLGNKLGEGKYGIVYRAIYQHAEVAVKQLHALTDEAVLALRYEATVMVKLQHPHIVRLLGVCLEPENYAIVMEYMAGGTLYHLLNERDEKGDGDYKHILTWSKRYQIAFDVGVGIAYLHCHDVIHSDLKSLNVLLDKNLCAKISDFGLSIIKQINKEKASSTYVIKGTKRWMAPELLWGETINTKASDVYAFGIILWELSARQGFPLAHIEDEFEFANAIRNGERDFISLDTPLAMAEVITHCWEQDYKTRWTIETAVEKLKIGLASLKDNGQEDSEKQEKMEKTERADSLNLADYYKERNPQTFFYSMAMREKDKLLKEKETVERFEESQQFISSANVSK